MINIIKTIVIVLLSILMFMGGYAHLFTPEVSDGFIADFLPKDLIHYGAAFVEIGLGVAALIPQSRKWGLKGILFLMFAFLFIHIYDLFREVPVLGNVKNATIRLVVQIVVVSLAWWVQIPDRWKSSFV